MSSISELVPCFLFDGRKNYANMIVSPMNNTVKVYREKYGFTYEKLSEKACS
jgi:hypothetical protein